MAKNVTDVFGKVKGADKISDVLTGKGAFSKTGFADNVNALANDTSFLIKQYDKDGKQVGTINLSELIRSDVKATIQKAGYPQKSEAAVLDTAEIVTKGTSEAIPYIVMEQLKQGKKFDLPMQPNVQGSVYLAPVKGKEKTSKIRDIQTKAELGTVTTKTKDSIQVRVKSPVPNACIISKVRKDTTGKVVNG